MSLDPCAYVIIGSQRNTLTCVCNTDSQTDRQVTKPNMFSNRGDTTPADRGLRDVDLKLYPSVMLQTLPVYIVHMSPENTTLGVLQTKKVYCNLEIKSLYAMHS